MADKIIIEVGIGNNIESSIAKAAKIVSLTGDNVTFDFNGYRYETSINPSFCEGVKEVSGWNAAWKYIAIDNNYITYFVTHNGAKTSLRKKTDKELSF